ncbi:ferredoxin Fer [Halocatena salina]|uniref:DnaJ domain-containing protein n=1 Tax=Halocatena salina TaxID=2934340 RepID=A0A8U0A0P3_9EURY|nr:ferredoxin Fer [Halocatena salina]UPM42690.1 DnaJ domain-containing protein [Halocatena salina]
MVSPFEVLQIDADADDAEVERAYRQRVKETHPDQGGSISEFQQVQSAYTMLTGEDVEDGHPDDNAGRTDTSRVEYLNYEVLDDHGWNFDDENLFEKATAVDLPPADHGQFLVHPHESLLEAAENRGFVWPYACRGGACANCAVGVLEGELEMPVNTILPSEMLECGIRLSCNGFPITETMKVVYNIKHLPRLDDLRLPPRPFEDAYDD